MDKKLEYIKISNTCRMDNFSKVLVWGSKRKTNYLIMGPAACPVLSVLMPTISRALSFHRWISMSRVLFSTWGFAVACARPGGFAVACARPTCAWLPCLCWVMLVFGLCDRSSWIRVACVPVLCLVSHWPAQSPCYMIVCTLGTAWCACVSGGSF